MIFVVIEWVAILLLLFLAVYLIYKAVDRIIQKRKQEEKNNQDKNEAIKFLKFGDAKAIILDHAEKLSLVREISTDEAILIVLSSDYLPGVGQLSISENDMVSPPIRMPRKRQKEKNNV